MLLKYVPLLGFYLKGAPIHVYSKIQAFLFVHCCNMYIMYTICWSIIMFRELQCFMYSLKLFLAAILLTKTLRTQLMCWYKFYNKHWCTVQFLLLVSIIFCLVFHFFCSSGPSVVSYSPYCV